jgi:acetoin utilization protein AcuB
MFGKENFMTASDLMTRDPLHVNQLTTLQEVESFLYENDIRHLPVVDGNGELIGMISDRDLREYSYDQLASTSTAEAMQGGVIAAFPESEVAELIELLLEYRVGAIPIIAPSSQQLVGIVSYTDILRAARPMFEE